MRFGTRSLYDKHTRQSAAKYQTQWPLFTPRIRSLIALRLTVIGVNLNFFTREIVYGAPSTQWWTELSSAIAGGLVVATVLTLIVTPAMLMLGEKERHLGKPVPLPNE